MFLVSFGMTKFFHLSENCAGICQAMMLFGNIGFMAVPVISSVFPGNGILYVSVFMVFDQLMLWTLGVKLTTPPGSGGFELKKLINPATVAILIGMLLMLTGVRIPALLDTGLQKIGATASPLAMIYIGGIFAELPLKKYLKEFYLITEEKECYQENDIMLGMRYLNELANRYDMPLVICIALGSNMAGHNAPLPITGLLEM